MSFEMRKYLVCAQGMRTLVSIVGTFGSDHAWRVEAVRASGLDADPSFEAEQVLRVFAWWQS